MRQPSVFLTVMLIFLTGILPVQADTSTVQANETTPADLLPDNTGLYFELSGQNLPADLDTLASFFAPDGTDIPSSVDFFAETDFAAWMGERVGVGVYVPFDLNNLNLLDVFPALTLIFQVRDETAADAFVEDVTGQGWKQTISDSYRIWKNHRSLEGRSILRTPGYLVMSDARGIETVTEVLESEKMPLTQNEDFIHITSAFSGTLSAWVYSKIGGVALYTGDMVSIEAVLLGDSPDELPDPISTSALEAVPQDAFVVVAGTDFDIPLAQLGELPQLLLDFVAMLTDTAQISALGESFFRTTFGVDYEREFLPLFDGEYAAFLTFGFGSVDDTLGVPVDGGIIVAPQEATNGVFTANTIVTRLQELELPIARVSPTLYVYDTGDILSGLDFYLGFTQGRLYFSTESGAEDIRNTLDGRNITDNAVWQRTFEYAPEGTQFALYTNLQTAAAFLNAGQEFLPDELQAPLQNFLLAVTDYVRQFDSLALFGRTHADGTRTWKLVLLPN